MTGTRTEDRGQGLLGRLAGLGADEELSVISRTAFLGTHRPKVIDWIRHAENVHGALTLVQGTLDLEIE